MKDVCVNCNVRFDNLRRQRKDFRPRLVSAEFLKQLNGSSLLVGDKICLKCFKLCQKQPIIVEPLSQAVTSSQSSSNDPAFTDIEMEETADTVNLHTIKRAASNQKYCMVCKCTESRQRISLEVRRNVFQEKRIYIPQNNRCCPCHLINNSVYEDDLNSISIISDTATISLDDYKLLTSSDGSGSVLSKFISRTVTNEECINICGLSKDNFYTLFSMLNSVNEKHNSLEGLLAFLCKMRSDLSHSALSSFLGLQSKQHVSRLLEMIEEAFEIDILPAFLGSTVNDRDTLINHHSTATAKHLFGESNLILIADGTYAFHEKSNNYSYLKQSYSVNKHAHLCKPFTVCTTTGYIIDIFGPYEAKMSDSDILKELINIGEMSNILKCGDSFILDRGFRDCVSVLSDYGIKCYMPSFKVKNKQFTTSEANQSRCVTMCRWVVEAIHGILKQKFKILKTTFPNTLLPKVRTYFRVAAALQNMFGNSLRTEIDFDQNIRKQIDIRKPMANELFALVTANNLEKRSARFVSIDANGLCDFPRLSLDDLKLMTLGSYQLKQAICYLAEHFKNEKFDILVSPIAPGIVKAKMQSRFRSQRIYNVFVQYSTSCNGADAITGWMCQCDNGLRTLGCCSHIACVMYYLGYGRYISRVWKPAESLSRLFSIHPTTLNDDSDEE